MIHRDEITSKVKVLTISCGDSASILFAQTAVRPDGKSRTMTQKVRVPDALISSLCAEVHEGDEIEATIVTEWSDKGYSTYLHGFRSLVSVPSAILR